jgi:DNA-binding transcriptional ArsR family regulator
MPCPGLGRSLSLCEDGDRIVILYTPMPTDDHAANARSGRSGIALFRFAPLAPTMQALGDRTRLAIVLHLLEHGPLSMQQLIDALKVHQSTISRQVAALRRAGLVEQVEDGDQRRIHVNRDPLREACRTLQEALE